MFNDCPVEVKKMIFARVRHMDLYEVSRVSQEWWTLTMATCRPTSDKYSRFFEFQVVFCNEVKPKEGGWEKWMFIEFIDDKTIELRGSPDDKMVEYLEQKGIHVRKLIYRGDLSILPNSKELFPDMQTLDFTLDSYNFDGEAVELPDGIKHLGLTILSIYPRSQLLDVFKHFERVESLYIFSSHRILFGNIRFDNLKHLSLNMSEKSTQDVISLVNFSKQLSSVNLINGQIDKEWLGLFPTNVQKIHLYRMRLAEAIPPFLGTADAFVERQLMLFVCQDWTKIRIFKSSNLSSDNGYIATYVCRPLVHEEQLEIRIYRDRIPNGLLESGNLQLKVLKLGEVENTKLDLNIIVPKSAQHFEWSTNNFKAFNIAVLFEDISNIKTLRFNSLRDGKLQFGEFPHAVNLVSLDISKVDDIILASLIRSSPSLKQLVLKSPRGMPFSKLPAELQSLSVKELTIIEPKDSLTNILGHFPYLVDLQLISVIMDTVTMADLAKLTSVKFVRINFVNVNDLDVLNQVVNRLDYLSFFHVIIGYSSENEKLSCVMGEEIAFFRRYLSSSSKLDFTKMNIQQLSDFFHYGSLFYVEGFSSLHLSSWSEHFQISYNLREFIAEASIEFQ